MPSSPRSVKIYIVTDGASRGNRGPSAIGFGIYNSSWTPLEERADYIGDATNNEAEYRAVMAALDCAAGHCRGVVEHYSDSELVVNQLNGRYRVRARNLKPLIEEVFRKRQYFASVTHMHLPKTNPRITKIDRMVNRKLDEMGYPPLPN